ncbi:beta-1,3-glucan-binding protein-like [Liolophura sinensis]|uniref:beta-1,3-glucan-binding protein-like n=1 Tax=Liolophura sinensis TaxID=3198878 RepID=UPI0031587089
MELVSFLAALTSVFRAVTLPEPVITRLGDGGIRFQVNDVPGTAQVGLHFSVNKPVHGLAPGDANANLKYQQDGTWVYESHNASLSSSDTVYYWLHQTVHGMSYTLTDRKWTVPSRLRLILEDHFDTLNLTEWEHEVTASGGGNWEFQIYSQEEVNSYVRDNTLFIKPTLTSDKFGEAFLYNGTLNMTELFGKCTQSDFYGCFREGKYGVINPIMSARIITKKSFKYGRVEIWAKMPRGDWIWPAMWFLPKNWEYGTWPRSGEIDLVEVRGNRHYGDIGIGTMGSTLHWGPVWNVNGYRLTTQERHAKPKWTFADGFHKYVLDWDYTHIRTYVDDELVLDMPTPEEGYWKFGGFSGEDIWAKGGRDAPFDKEFYLILNVAIGGKLGYFPDDVPNEGHKKPWANDSPRAADEFWAAKDDWYPTWIHEDAALQVKSVKIWEKAD